MATADAYELVERRIQYEPLPSQTRFHCNVSRFRGYSGPVGSGKTVALVMECIRLAAVNPGLLGLMAAPTYPMLRDVFQRTMLETLENNKIPFNFLKQENHLELIDTGSEIIFRSADDPTRLVGTNLAWFAVDELTFCKQESWLRLEARLRHPLAVQLSGIAAWTPNGFDWVYDKFIAGSEANYHATLARPRENKYLPDGFYDSLQQSYDPKFYQQEVLGEYLAVNTGRVYHGFSDQNLEDVQYDPALPIIWALDFNVDPLCSVIVQCLGREIRVLDELFLRNSHTQAACDAFMERFDIRGWTWPHQIHIHGDTSGRSRGTRASRSDYDLIQTALRNIAGVTVRLDVPAANPPVKDRVNAVNASLCNALQETHLLIHPRCEELVRDLRQVTWNAGATVEIDKRSDPKRTHISDALGYYIARDHPVSAFRRQIRTQ